MRRATGRLISSLVLVVLATLVWRGNCHPHLFNGELGGNEFRFRDKLYLTVRRDLYQPEAEFFCRRWGGRLASMPDQETREYFQYITSIDVYDYHHWWIGVMTDGVYEALQVLIADERLYIDCDVAPEDCEHDGPGPFFDFDVVKESCVFDNSCTDTKYVDAFGNNVTFLPWLPGNPTMSQCGELIIEDCNHLDGCTFSGLNTTGCVSYDYGGAICEKDECSAYSVVPNPLPEVDEEEPWEDFLGLQVYCGPNFYRVVLGTCAVEYADIQNLRLGSSPTSDDTCNARYGNVLEAEIGTGTCGIKTTVLQGNTEFFTFTPKTFVYEFTIHGEFGKGRHPEAGDDVKRYRPITLYSRCYYLAGISMDSFSNYLITSNQRKKVIQGTSGSGSFELFMLFFKDEAMAEPLTGSPPTITIPNPIYVAVAASSPSALIQAVDCWASDSSEFLRGDTVTYWDLITDTCAVTTHVSVISNGVGPQVSFSFDSFYFTNSPTPYIYVHCQMEVCDPVTGCESNPCVSGKRKRRRLPGLKKWDEQMSIGPNRILFNDEVAFENSPPQPPLVSDEENSQDSKEPGNPCDDTNGGCTHECVADDENKATCVCPHEMTLKEDGKSCQEVAYLDVEDDESADRLLMYSALVFVLAAVLAIGTWRMYKSTSAKNLVLHSA